MAGNEAAGTTWHYFISYTQADRAWAEWIAWLLEEDDRRVLIQAWDFVPGSNWIKGMQDGVTAAERTIAVLSPAYLKSVYGAAEWQAAWAADPDGADRRLLTVRVEKCDRPGFLDGVVGIDLFGVVEVKARDRVRDMVRRAEAGRAKPAVRPAFPGSGRAVPAEPPFPGRLAARGLPPRNPAFTGRAELLNGLLLVVAGWAACRLASRDGCGAALA